MVKKESLNKNEFNQSNKNNKKLNVETDVNIKRDKKNSNNKISKNNENDNKKENNKIDKSVKKTSKKLNNKIGNNVKIENKNFNNKVDKDNKTNNKSLSKQENHEEISKITKNKTTEIKLKKTKNIKKTKVVKLEKLKPKRKNNFKKRKIIKILIIFFSIFNFFCIGFIVYANSKISLLNQNNKTEKEKLINYQDYFASEVITLNKKILYKIVDNDLKISGVINDNISLALEESKLTNEGYFKIKDLPYYIDYENIKSTKIAEEKSTFTNYIPYNESVVVTNPTFYLDDKITFKINGEFKFPILIKENNYYGVVFENKLYYLKKDDVTVINENNTNLKSTNGISVLTYHFTYDSNSQEERKDCNQIICLSDKQFRKHMQFIKDEGFYTATLRDLELFIDGKIRLPEKTVVITIDDGNYILKSVEILEDLDLHATVFLIGSVGETTGYDYKSPNIEVHSHTYNLHYVGACSGGQGSPLKCLNKNKILEDLKKSRESLNNTTYFCYPFFEYNNYAINILKEAGFTMAFTGGRYKVKKGTNKYLVPRYGIVNTTTTNDLKRIIY